MVSTRILILGIVCSVLTTTSLSLSALASKRQPQPKIGCNNLLLPDGSKVFLPEEHWNRYLGEVWYHLISSYRVPQDGVVVEIAPGSVEKIGLGLQAHGFRGTLIVIEPHGEALQTIVEKYRRLLPQATIVPSRKTLSNALPDLPRKVDAIVANHPLDDMIIGRSLTSEGFHDFFSKMYGASELELTQTLWNQLSVNPEQAERIIDEIASDWNALVTHTRPGLVAISQYPGMYHVQHGINVAEHYSVKALRKLRERWPSDSPTLARILNQVGQDHRRWIVHEPKRTFFADAKLKPAALNRSGHRTFITTDAARLSPTEIELIYFDKKLLAELGYDKLLANTDRLTTTLIDAFGIDLDSTASSTNNQERVWVDRQTDPLNIAMNGNLGSGRAVYKGNRFNLKGVGRTPLVRAPENSNHGNGRLAFSSALWETIVSNSLRNSLGIQTSPVLAVFRYRNKNFPAPWGDGSIKTEAGLIVRIDDGALDRPVHLFQNPAARKKTDLRALARRFAEQDADKFIDRIVHGAWSSGNISLQGHLLDMDTVTAVAGRSPQYSLTGRFAANLFGLESIGQLAIIRALTQHPEINSEGLSYESLEICFNQARQHHMTRRILDLFGVEPIFNPKARLAKQSELIFLVAIFEELSQKMFPDFSALGTWNKNSRSAHVFDFSSFFRYYPLLRMFYSNKNLRLRAGMKYLGPDAGNFEIKENVWISPEVKAILNRKYLVKSNRELSRLKQKARKFVADFDRFLDDLEELGLYQNKDQAVIRAFLINEDRPYLSDSYGAPFIFQAAAEHQADRMTTKQLSRLVSVLIRANDRSNEKNIDGSYTSDMRIFKEAYLHRVIASNLKHRIQITIFDEHIPPQAALLDWTLTVNGVPHPLTASLDEADGLRLITGELDPELLLMRKIKLTISHGNRPIPLTDLSDSRPRSDFTLEVEQE